MYRGLVDIFLLKILRSCPKVLQNTLLKIPHRLLLYEKELFKKKTLWLLFLWMGFNCLKATATSRRQFTFYHSVPRYSWYSFYQPRKDERLSRPWSHSVVLITGPLDWESSALTTRPLLMPIVKN